MYICITIHLFYILSFFNPLPKLFIKLIIFEYFNQNLEDIELPSKALC